MFFILFYLFLLFFLLRFFLNIIFRGFWFQFRTQLFQSFFFFIALFIKALTFWISIRTRKWCCWFCNPHLLFFFMNIFFILWWSFAFVLPFRGIVFSLFVAFIVFVPHILRRYFLMFHENNWFILLRWRETIAASVHKLELFMNGR